MDKHFQLTYLKNNNFNDGLTLIELMVTLIIMSILVIASVSVIRHLLIDNRLKAAAESFSQQVRMARSEAIQRQQDIFLNLQSGASWCYGIKADSTCSCATNTCTLGSVSYTTYTGVIVNSTGFSGGDIYFDGIRGLADEASSVNFTASSKTITVNISRLGNVSICSSDITGYPAC